MKKTFMILVVLLGMATISTQAQTTKYGHVNSSEILQMMPGVDSLQIKLMAFQTSLEELYKSMVAEYENLTKKLDLEAGTMSSSVRQMREKEIDDLKNRIQEFEYGVQEDLEEEQYRLAKPFQDKIQNAINDVAKENGYAYVFDTQTLLFYDNGDDITPLVKKKLGLK